jgi:two-component system chemotaxis sensor kinase CheA
VAPESTPTDDEIANLIFAPGLSTASSVSDVSGRGVGMDVVKRSVESLHGRVEVTSQPGAGTTFRIRLPLTMAIIDGMLLRVGAQRYLLPTVSIVESCRPTATSITDLAGKGDVVLLRDEVLRVIRLADIVGAANADSNPERSMLVIIDSCGKRCALLVDELQGQQQVVIKSLGEGFGRLPGISGAAILGDGRVGLILDAATLVDMAEAQVRRRGSASPPPSKPLSEGA